MKREQGKSLKVRVVSKVVEIVCERKGEGVSEGRVSEQPRLLETILVTN